MVAKLIVLVFSALVVAPQDDDELARKRIKECRASLKKAQSDGDLIAAIEELGAMRHPKILAELSFLLRGYTPNVRKETAKQVAKYKESVPAAVALLQRAEREKKNGNLAAHYLKCIGQVRARAVAPFMIRFYSDKRIIVAKSAIQASGKLRSRAVIEPLIKLARKLDNARRSSEGYGAPSTPGSNYGNVPNLPPYARQSQNDEILKRKSELLPVILQALKETTGERYNRVSDWVRWWKKNSRKWKEPIK